MPRSARIDAPGALQHVMARGIERRSIFRDDDDRERFLRILARILAETGTRCFAFALMSNHYHLLLVTGATPLSRVMARLGTAYALGFNRRHHRVGHLFQNRYKSKLVQGDTGLMTLVRYIHRNPLEAGMVLDLRSLADYPWTGHGALLGRRRAPFLDTQTVLASFGGNVPSARRRLLQWMDRDTAEEQGPVPPGAGLQEGFLEVTDPGLPPPVDLLEEEIRRRRLGELGWNATRVRSAVCEQLALDPALLAPGCRTRIASRAREAIAALVVHSLGGSHTEAAAAAGVTRQSLEEALARFAAWPEEQRREILNLLPTIDVRNLQPANVPASSSCVPETD
jgi:REP element-mobilizing transposase RayT